MWILGLKGLSSSLQSVNSTMVQHGLISLLHVGLSLAFSCPLKFSEFYLYNNCHLEFFSPVSGMITKISEKEKYPFFFSF